MISTAVQQKIEGAVDKHLLSDKQLVKLLTEYNQKLDIVRILDRKSFTISGKGENNISITWKELVCLLNKHGDTWYEHIIVKRLPEDGAARQFIDNEGFYRKEIKMYTQIFPKMEEILNKTDFNWDNNEDGCYLWPKYLGRNISTILLEDLTAVGYKKVDRLEGLDLAHTLSTVKALAKFHILSIALMKWFPNLHIEKFIKYNEISLNSCRAKMFKFKMKQLAVLIKQNWEPKWWNFADQLENNVDGLYSRFEELIRTDERNFNVLNHGDPWTSNFLFKYSPLSGQIISVRIVDYQMCFYNSFAIDLHWLFNTSVQIAVIQEHLDTILFAYHQTLHSMGNSLGLKTKLKLPTVDEIRLEMKRKYLVGTILSITLLDLLMVDPNEAGNFDTFLTNTDNYRNHWKTLTSKVYQERMSNILLPYINLDFINW